jgi:hypothetical protein
MTEARADAFYDRAELADALREIMLYLPWARRGVPPVQAPDDQFCHGVTGSTRVNRAVGFALAHDLQNQLARRSQPRSRYWLRLRREFNTHARLYPVTADGCVPDREQNLPSLPQIARFLTWATKVKTGTRYLS